MNIVIDKSIPGCEIARTTSGKILKITWKENPLKYSFIFSGEINSPVGMKIRANK